MTDPQQDSLRRLARNAGLIGIAALIGSAVLAGFAPRAAVAAYRFALFACLQPAVGSLIFRLIHRITGGQWGDALAPLLDAGARLVPWIWPLALPLLFLPGAHPVRPPGLLPPGTGTTGLLIRALVYEAILIGIRRIALDGRLQRFAAPGLIALVFTLHVLAADWFFTIEPGWYSTAFPVVWMSVQAVAGLSLALVLVPLIGCDPSKPGPAGRPLGYDFGNLLMTALIFSTYLAFMQFLIIWSGNLPREIAWFERRTAMGWRVIACALALFHIFVPLGFLLSKKWKLRRTGTPRLGAALCAVEVVWAAWFILPPFAGLGAWLAVLSALLLGAGACLFLNRYLAGVSLGEAAA